MGRSAAWFLLATCVVACGDGGDPFSEAEVLSFAVEAESEPSQIHNAERRIDVTLPSSAALAHAEVRELTLSARATSDLKLGDVLDLSQARPFAVTSENGTRAEWQLVGHVAEGEDDAGSGGGAGGDCPGDELLTYQLEGKFQITDTAGDSINDVGPGELVLRVGTGDSSRSVSLVSYQLTEKFVTGPSGVASVRTDNETSAGPSDCGVAEGSLDGDVLTWKACDYGPAPPHGTTEWTPADVVGGPGCMRDYHVLGTVSCSGAFCSLGGDFPIHLDETYPQPLNSFEFSSDLASFDMKDLGQPADNGATTGVELPNEQQGRAWLSLHGTLTDRSCAPVLECTP